MSGIDFKSIKTDRLILRQFKDSDIDSFYKYRANPDVALYQGWENYTYDQAVQFVNEQKSFKSNIPDTWFQIAIELKENGAMIGDCALHTLSEDSNQAEIGFTLEPEYQHRGYMREAVKCLLDYLFRDLGKHRVTASADVRNKASYQLMEAMGMRREGHFIKNGWYKGEYTDEYQYAVLEEEWLKK
jgi:RimJ/RimL family protein N-acetyltransferase